MLRKVRRLIPLLAKEKVPIYVVRYGCSLGWCPVCEKTTIFYKRARWLRDNFLCIRCMSTPRTRALIRVLETHLPEWRGLTIHESSPGGSASNRIARECRDYTPTHYFRETPLGHIEKGYRCEDLEQQTFPDCSFDLVVTQDVFEHVFDPAAAFAEICRTLKPGGVHLFTVPWFHQQNTVMRAVREGSRIRHIEAPHYHRNPIDPRGSLVVTDWGWDLCDFIYRSCGMTTTVITIVHPRYGIEGEGVYVFVSRKPMAEPQLTM